MEGLAVGLHHVEAGIEQAVAATVIVVSSAPSGQRSSTSRKAIRCPAAVSESPGCGRPQRRGLREAGGANRTSTGRSRTAASISSVEPSSTTMISSQRHAWRMLAIASLVKAAQARPMLCTPASIITGRARTRSAAARRRAIGRRPTADRPAGSAMAAAISAVSAASSAMACQHGGDLADHPADEIVSRLPGVRQLGQRRERRRAGQGRGVYPARNCVGTAVAEPRGRALRSGACVDDVGGAAGWESQDRLLLARVRVKLLRDQGGETRKALGLRRVEFSRVVEAVDARLGIETDHHIVVADIAEFPPPGRPAPSRTGRRRRDRCRSRPRRVIRRYLAAACSSSLAARLHRSQ